MSSLLYRLGQFSVRRRRFVLAAWILGLVAILVISRAAGGKTTNTFSIPGTQSQQAADLLSKRFPAQSGSSVQVVFAAPASGTLTAPADRAKLDAVINRLDHLPGVVTPANPAATLTFSPDGTVALANVTYQ